MQRYMSLNSLILVSAIILHGSCNVINRHSSEDEDEFLEIQRLNPDPLRPSFDDLPPIMRKYSIPEEPVLLRDSAFSPIMEPTSAMEAIFDRNKHLIDANIPGMLEGDIYLGPMKHRSATGYEDSLWPDNTVPYVIDPVYNYHDARRIKNGMEDFHTFTCIRFVERTTQPYYLYITPLDGCWSGFGFGNTAGQKVSLGKHCVYHSTILHELMHALGFFHEQNRKDRDDYVIVYEENISDMGQGQFSKVYGKSTTQGTPYDYDTLMHYSRKAFSKNGSPTVVAKYDYNKPLGESNSFTKWDFVELNGLYKCGYSLDVWYNHMKECMLDYNLRRRKPGAEINDGTEDLARDVQGCCELCKVTHNCRSFSFRKTGGNLGECWLQSEWVGGYTDTEYDSGIIWPWPEDEEDDGNNGDDNNENGGGEDDGNNGDDNNENGGGEDDDDDEEEEETECVNKNEHCEAWAATGECEKNSKYMLSYCAKSCKEECNADIECTNTNEKCEEWAGKGECEKNPAYMLPYCPKSCKAECKTEGGGGDNGDECVNKDDNCGGWAFRGECEKNPVYMLSNCAKSCKPECKGVDGVVDCDNKNDQCDTWASKGECDENPEYMLNYCPNSCKPECKEDVGTVTKKWRDDLRCGPSFPLPDGSPAQCNPNGLHPCCSPHAWCGTTPAHCECDTCISYRGK